MTDLYDGYMTEEGEFVAVLNPTTFTYDSAGNRLTQTTPYGVVTSASFDELNRVLSFSSRDGWGAGTLLYQINYQYDLAGNRRSAEESIAGIGYRFITWDYDGLYRLTSESWTGDPGTQPQSRSYSYDPAGNRLTKSVTWPEDAETVVTSYQYDDRNRLLISVTGDSNSGFVTTHYGYDFNGNLTGKNVDGGLGTAYVYDVANRLIQAYTSTGGLVFQAYYDGRSRRIGKIENGGRVTLYRYDGGTNFQEWLDTDGEGTPELITELIRAGGLGGGIGSILYTDRTGEENTPGPWEGFLFNAVQHGDPPLFCVVYFFCS